MVRFVRSHERRQAGEIRGISGNTTPALSGPAMTEHRDYGRRHGAIRPTPGAATGAGDPWCFREHNTGPPGPSGHGGPRLRSFAAVQHSPRDAFRRRHIARRELAVQHEAAQLVFDNADPWPRLSVEDTHEVIAGQGAFGAQLYRFLAFDAFAGRCQGVVVLMVVVSVARVIGALQGDQIAPMAG